MTNFRTQTPEQQRFNQEAEARGFEEAGLVPPDALPGEQAPTRSVTVIPEGAEPIERDALGNVTVYQQDGERFFTPASTSHKQGFKTETERIKAQQVGATMGPHQGPLVKKDAVVIMLGNKPVGRVTRKALTKLDIPENRLRIPAVTETGREVLLKNKDVEAFNRNIVAKNLDIKKANIAISARNFIAQQDLKRFNKLNVELPDGKYISKTKLNKLPNDIKKVFTLKGFDAGNTEIDRQNQASTLLFIKNNQAQDAVNIAVTKPTTKNKNNAVKAVWQFMTPWDESAGKNHIDYMKEFPGKIKEGYAASIKQEIRTPVGFKPVDSKEAQTELKKQYGEQESNRAILAKNPPTGLVGLMVLVLSAPEMPVVKSTVDGKILFTPVLGGEAPVVGGKKVTEKVVRKAVKVAVKERVDWSKIKAAFERTERLKRELATTNPKKAAKVVSDTVKKAVRKTTISPSRRAGLTPKQKGIQAIKQESNKASWEQYIKDFPKRQKANQTQRLDSLKVVPFIGLNERALNKAKSQGVTETEVQTRIQAATILSNAVQTATNPAIQTEVKQSPQEQIQEQLKQLPDIATRTRTQTELKQQTKPQEKTKPKELTKPQEQTKPETPTKPPVKKPPTKPPVKKPPTKPPVKKPPTKPPTKPPIRFRLKKRGEGEELEELTTKERKAAISWKQGLGWWTILPDGRNFFTLKPPKGVKIVKGRPARTIQKVRGTKTPHIVTADLGNRDIRITFPSKGIKGKIDFASDPKLQTRQMVQLGRSGERSVKKGKLFHTKTKGGTLLSRRRLT